MLKVQRKLRQQGLVCQHRSNHANTQLGCYSTQTWPQLCFTQEQAPGAERGQRKGEGTSEPAEAGMAFQPCKRAGMPGFRTLAGHLQLHTGAWGSHPANSVGGGTPTCSWLPWPHLPCCSYSKWAGAAITVSYDCATDSSLGNRERPIWYIRW